MKKIKGKILALGLSILSLLIYSSKCQAETYTGDIYSAEYIGDIFVKKVRNDGYYQFKHARFLRKSTDDNYVYCLEPFIDIVHNSPYDVYETDYATHLNISEELWQRIELLAYYGYGYQENGYDHTDSKWYYITQILIWQTVEPDIKVYFTQGLNGKIIERFTEEFAEVEALVSNHFKTPNFSLEKDIYSINETINLKDSNNVLKNFDITTSDNIRIERNENNLSIKTLSSGNATITFTKKGNRFKANSWLYYSTTSQKVLEPGNFKDVQSQIQFKVKSSKIRIHKVDEETNETLLIKGIKFKLLDASKKEICDNNSCIFTTNEDGIVNLDYPLGIGQYYLQEIDSNMPGYLLNPNLISFQVDENSAEIIDINFPNKRAKGKISITKYGEKLTFADYKYAYEDILLSEVKLNIYANEDIYVNKKLKYAKNDLVASLITVDGKADLDLELGSYYIVEMASAMDNLVNTEPIYFSLEYKDNLTPVIEYDLVLHNYLPKGILEIIKIDAETKSPLQNALIAIYNLKDELIFTGLTNDEGKIIINDLPLGTYYLKELKAPSNYILSNEIIHFTISEDKEKVTITMENKKEEKEEKKDEPKVESYIDIKVPDTFESTSELTYIVPDKKKRNCL